jgi:hypothetical protein
MCSAKSFPFAEFGLARQPVRWASDRPALGKETQMNALPAILSIFAAAAAISLAITAFVNV